MIDWILDFRFNSLLGLALYWVPASLCAYGYTVRTWVNYQRDVKLRESAPKSYYPSDTVGDLIGRAVVTVIPVANLWAASFDVAPRLFSALFAWIGRVFDQPLVPKKDPPQ